jgi:hypothetical protein
MLQDIWTENQDMIQALGGLATPEHKFTNAED